MSTQHPEDEDGPRRTEVNAEFEAIVADWAASGEAPNWPEGSSRDASEAGSGSSPADADADPGPAGGAGTTSSGTGTVWRGSQVPFDAETADAIGTGGEEEHYVPPDPPPLPRVGAHTIGAVLLILLGVVLLVVPGLVPGLSLVLGLLCITGGIAWLIARLRHDPPGDSGWDDGARV